MSAHKHTDSDDSNVLLNVNGVQNLLDDLQTGVGGPLELVGLVFFFHHFQPHPRPALLRQGKE